MLELNQLNIASYKGVSFPCNETTTTAGRAKIIHRPANSNKYNIEDQGKNPRTYNLTAIITGENYFDKRDALLSAIESPGLGVLIHPFFGRIENVAAFPVTFDQKVNALGTINIPIRFEVSDSEGVPSLIQISSSGISSRKDDVLAAVSENVATDFEVTNSFTGNFTAATSKVTSFSNSIVANIASSPLVGGIGSAFGAVQGAIGSVQGSISSTIGSLGTTLGISSSITGKINAFAVAKFNAKVGQLNINVNSLVGNPAALGNAITGIMGDIPTLYSDPQQVLQVSSMFFNFGDNDPLIKPTTAGLLQRSNNNNILNFAVKASALAVAYEASSLTKFKTVSSISSVSVSLENIFKSLKKEGKQEQSVTGD